MNATSVLIPKLIRAQSNAAITALEAGNGNLERAKIAFGPVVNDLTLRGASFDNVKRKCEDYLLIANALISANEADIVDHRKLIRLVGNQNLVGAEILPLQGSYKLARRTAESSMAHYRSIKSSTAWWQRLLCGVASAMHNRAVEQYGIHQDLFNNADAQVRLLQDKRNDFTRIQNATRGLFANGNALRTTALSGLELIELASTGLPDSYNAVGIGRWRNDLLNGKDALVNAMVERLRYGDGFDWDAISLIFDRGYENITSLEFDALAEIYIHISLHTPDVLDQFINSMGIKISTGFYMGNTVKPHLMQEADRLAFQALDTIWHFDHRSTNAIRDRVEVRIAGLLELEWSQTSGSSDRAATRDKRFVLLQASGVLFGVSHLTPIIREDTNNHDPSRSNERHSEVIFGTAYSPGITTTRNPDGTVSLNFAHLYKFLNSNNPAFNTAMPMPNNERDHMHLNGYRLREVVVSRVYEYVPRGEQRRKTPSLFCAIIDREEINRLANHEFNPAMSILSSVAPVTFIANPITGGIATVGGAFAAPFVDQARITQVREDISGMADAAVFAGDADNEKLNGVFISEDGISRPPLLWFSPYEAGGPVDRQYLP